MLPFFLSCDWGTTALRLQWVKVPELKVLHSIHLNDSGLGQLNLSADEKKELLDRQLQLLIKEASGPADAPCIVSGMASSTIGIRELPYGTLPLTLSTFKIPYRKLEENVYLVSGIAGEEDVMRGEEVQILGAAQSLNGQRTLVILPGTHSKHATLEDNAMTFFKTYLSGELFALLRQHSILRHSLPEVPDESIDFSAFQDGLNASKGELLNTLFTIRARQLLQGKDPGYNHNFLSGLLIGTELQGLSHQTASQVLLIADGTLATLYQHALSFLFSKVSVHLFSTEEATILGHYQLVKTINV
jgi:2-dehydro-3-deoxygalactonokinase